MQHSVGEGSKLDPETNSRVGEGMLVVRLIWKCLLDQGSQ